MFLLSVARFSVTKQHNRPFCHEKTYFIQGQRIARIVQVTNPLSTVFHFSFDALSKNTIGHFVTKKKTNFIWLLTYRNKMCLIKLCDIIFHDVSFVSSPLLGDKTIQSTILSRKNIFYPRSKDCQNRASDKPLSTAFFTFPLILCLCHKVKEQQNW